MDDRKSLSIAFLAISYQYAILILFSQNGCRRPFWMTENHFRSHFSPFQINTQLLFYFYFFFHKMAAGGHFGSPKITFVRISHHLRSIHNFFFTKWLPRPFWMTENHFRSHFSSFQIKTQLLFIYFFSQNGCRRPFWMNDNNFIFIKTFFFKMAAGGLFGSPIWAILDNRISLSIAFLAISDQYTTLFLKKNSNERRRPIWNSDLRPNQ